MRHIFFVEQFFWPEAWPGNNPSCRNLSHDYNVTVICGNRPYIKPQNLDDCKHFGDQLIIRHLYLPFKSHKSFARVINQIFFSIQLLHRICVYRPRLIIAQTNPPLALPILAITKKLFSIPYIVICMDLYPMS